MIACCPRTALFKAAILVGTLLGVARAGVADGAWSATIATDTDYVFRGISQTYGGAAVQGGVSYRHPSGWLAGAWASNVGPYPFGVGAVEVNLYTSFGWSLSPTWTARTAYTHYVYAWDRRHAPYDYNEFAMTVAYEDLLAATVSYQPDSTLYSTFGYVRDRPSTAVEVSGSWPLPHGIALSAGLGHYDLTRLYHLDYWSGSAGASYTLGRAQFNLTRFFSDRTARRLFEDATADGRWVASAVWRF